MGTPKKYSSTVDYEKKLSTVMTRLGVSEFNYDWSRSSCFIEFTYKGQLYRFDHTLEKAATSGQNIRYVSDLFAQLVITLEDIARMVERGIYDLSIWVSGMRALPESAPIPDCFRTLGFEQIPPDMGEVRIRYRALAKVAHPDCGGSDEHFRAINQAYTDALDYFSSQKENRLE